MIKFWYVPICFIVYFVSSVLSVQQSRYGDKWGIYAYLISVLPLWFAVVKYTDPKELGFTGIIYDLIVLFSYTAGCWYMGAFAGTSLINKIGITLILIGVVLMKLPK